MMQVPLAIPVGATAQRPSWPALPAGVRAAVEGQLGSPVTGWASQGSGFTQGFASRLRLADGAGVFVKAVDSSIGWLRDAYAREADIVAVLPAGVPAPRLRHRLEVGSEPDRWLVLIFDDADGQPPKRPWVASEAETVLTAVTAMSEALTPAPSGPAWTGLTEEFFDFSQSWFAEPAHTAALGDIRDPVRELVALSTSALAGSSLVHSDLRDDNVILGAGGRTVWVCDWNWPTLGPVWTDAACVAIAMVGDGLDPAWVVSTSRLLTEADADAIDSLLAVLLLYFIDTGAKPPIESSPYLRSHQEWYARVVEGWLRSRRGW